MESSWSVGKGVSLNFKLALNELRILLVTLTHHLFNIPIESTSDRPNLEIIFPSKILKIRLVYFGKPAKRKNIQLVTFENYKTWIF